MVDQFGYLPNLKKLAKSRKCGLIVAASAALLDATKKASKAHPKQRFLVPVSDGSTIRLTRQCGNDLFCAGRLVNSASRPASRTACGK